MVKFIDAVSVDENLLHFLSLACCPASLSIVTLDVYGRVLHWMCLLWQQACSHSVLIQA